MDLSQDFVMRKGGQMIVMINGDMLIMEEDVYTADGTLITKDGTLVTPDGEIGMLHEDEAMVFDLVVTDKLRK